MQEKKNKRLAIIFLVLCCVTLAAYYIGKTGGTVDVDKQLFKNYNLQDIDQINLESRQGTVQLKFNGSKWVVNEHTSADASMVQVLFATLQQAEPKRPVSPSIRDSLGRDLKSSGVKVTLFSSGSKELTFYAGGNFKKTQAYFCGEGQDDMPYIMTIPGYRVYVSGIFELPEKDWKDKLVFGFNWRNFDRLEARFPELPAQGFDVALRESYFGIEGMSKADTAKLNSFLDDVSLLTVDKFVDGPVFEDSLSKPTPTMIITVKDIAQRSYTLQLYRPSASSENSIPGLINGTQWAYFARERIEDILKRRAFFSE